MEKFEYKEPDKGHAIWGSEIKVKTANKQALLKLLQIMGKYDPKVEEVVKKVEGGGDEAVSGGDGDSGGGGGR